MLLALTVAPAGEPEPVRAADRLRRQGAPDFMRFRVAVLRRSGGDERTLREALLQVEPGDVAAITLGLVGVPADAGRPASAGAAAEGAASDERRHGRGVRTVGVTGYLPDSDFGEDNRVKPRGFSGGLRTERADTSWPEPRPDDLEPTWSMTRGRKLSKKKRAELAEQARRTQRRSRAIEASKRLPTDQAEAAAPEGEVLHVRLRPLHASDQHVQLRIELDGRLRLHADEATRPVDVRFTEMVAWGERLEVSLVELLGSATARSDTVITFTPEP